MATDTVSGIRDHILAAAQEIIAARGLKGATTRAIAERAGCAEGSIYRHFPDKQALFMECVRSRFPEFISMMEALPERAGTGTLRRNLEEVARAALDFYRNLMPMVGGLMSEHALLHEQRRYFHEHQTGPMKSFRLLTEYLAREQRLGRVSDRVSAAFSGRALLGACWTQAFMLELHGEDANAGSDDRFAHDLVAALWRGLSPGPSTRAVREGSGPAPRG